MYLLLPKASAVLTFETLYPDIQKDGLATYWQATDTTDMTARTNYTATLTTCATKFILARLDFKDVCLNSF
jgi:hypothetical protein